MSTQSAGRPGSAVLILVAIFATALLLRVPIGPAPADEIALVIDARVLDPWAATPVASMDPPATPSEIAAPRRIPSTTSILAPVEATLVASMIDTPWPEVSPRKPTAMSPEPVAAEPIAFTPQSHFAGFAAAVAPVSFVESPSRPFGVVGGAVGTAFVKTGAALTLALKKTGQGILAPF